MPEPLPSSPASTGKKNILLVEDYDPNILIATFFLRELGYEYEVAKNGSEAVDKFATGSYALIMMDLQMPGMDGFEAAKRIRAIEKSRNQSPVPILALTGHASEDDRLLCEKGGMNDYLSKPYRLGDLERKLQTLCPLKEPR